MKNHETFVKDIFHLFKSIVLQTCFFLCSYNLVLYVYLEVSEKDRWDWEFQNFSEIIKITKHFQEVVETGN